MPRPRWLLATAASLLALTIAACGGQAEDAQGEDTQPASAERVVQHAMGATTISGMPQRVVVLDTGELDSVLALGVKPVGSVRVDADQEFPAYLQDKTQGVETVGTIRAPDLEKIAALNPDLILSNKVRDADKYDTLRQIAPTVFAEEVGVAWKENFLLAGRALGKEAEAEQILADYEERARAVGRLAGNPAETEVSMVRQMPDSIRLYGKGSFIGTILEDAGFSRPEIQQVDETKVDISREQISQAEGDLIFYSGFGPTSQAALDELVAGPLWQNLSAVQNGKSYEVADDLWYLGIGPIAANLVLDDLEKFLTSS
ncbi:MAG: iron-siderophore ABC transporter substrate-binding protein [Actinomycetota bacterium]|nr:iron-siderophore ABC transporter substrate-binding protein [Actinomycetota bacterium]